MCIYVCVGGLGFPRTDCFDTASSSLNQLNCDLCDPVMEIIVTGCESSDLHYVLSFVWACVQTHTHRSVQLYMNNLILRSKRGHKSTWQLMRVCVCVRENMLVCVDDDNNNVYNVKGFSLSLCTIICHVSLAVPAITAPFFTHVRTHKMLHVYFIIIFIVAVPTYHTHKTLYFMFMRTFYHKRCASNFLFRSARENHRL